MKINLAKVVPFLGIGVVLLIWFASLNTSADTSPDYYDDDPYVSTSSAGYTDTARADAYFTRAARELAQPGVYVDPEVIAEGRMTRFEAEELDRLAADTPGPVRVLVVPADALREEDPDDPDASSYGNDIAYPDTDLPGQLYDRVGVDGTYLVLVDAESSYDGRSFNATQFSEERPFYQVEDAVDRAVDCCAPHYRSMIVAFLERAGDEQTNPWPIVGWVVGIGGGLLGLLLGGRRLLARRKEKAEDAEVADALRPSLQEEVIELETTVGALPPPSASDPPSIADRTRQVLDLVEQARHRLDENDGSARMDTPSEVEDVVLRLSDARYELVAIDALRRGEPVPREDRAVLLRPAARAEHRRRRSTPPSWARSARSRSARRCRDELAAGQVPPTRTIRIGEQVKPYWDWNRYSRPYVNGYWRKHTFPEPSFQRQRFGSAAPGRGGARAVLPVRLGERRRRRRLGLGRRWRRQPPELLRPLELAPFVRRRQLPPLVQPLERLAPVLSPASPTSPPPG